MLVELREQQVESWRNRRPVNLEVKFFYEKRMNRLNLEEKKEAFGYLDGPSSRSKCCKLVPHSFLDICFQTNVDLAVTCEISVMKPDRLPVGVQLAKDISDLIDRGVYNSTNLNYILPSLWFKTNIWKQAVLWIRILKLKMDPDSLEAKLWS